MADLPLREPVAAGPGSDPLGLPGLRTLRSPRFRVVLAAVLLVVASGVLGLLLVRQAVDPRGQFGVDFDDYYTAATRLLEGRSPYAPSMRLGPIDAQGLDRYRYPPPFAQLLMPLALLPREVATIAWLAVQAAAMMLAMWLATGLGGARRDLERLLWCAVAACFFLPVFDTLWKGNVSGIIALQVAGVAMAGLAAGVGAATGTLLKLVPVTLLPAALALDRPARRALVIVLVGVTALSLALAPSAWIDYSLVLPNLLAGSAAFPTNLAPAEVALRLGLSAELAGLVRLGTLAVSATAVALSVGAARRPGGAPLAAVLATVALLLLPSALWYHYLCVLLPLAALAWVRGGSRDRVGLLGGGALVTVSLVWLPLALVGATTMVIASLHALRPIRPQGSRGLPAPGPSSPGPSSPGPSSPGVSAGPR